MVMQLYNPVPVVESTDSIAISFEEILLSTLKQNKNSKNQAKPQKRIATGAEVITRTTSRNGGYYSKQK